MGRHQWLVEEHVVASIETIHPQTNIAHFQYKTRQYNTCMYMLLNTGTKTAY